jgi:hypothetical protein
MEGGRNHRQICNPALHFLQRSIVLPQRGIAQLKKPPPGLNRAAATRAGMQAGRRTGLPPQPT